jgi:hypothetical protein
MERALIFSIPAAKIIEKKLDYNTATTDNVTKLIILNTMLRMELRQRGGQHLKFLIFTEIWLNSS